MLSLLKLIFIQFFPKSSEKVDASKWNPADYFSLYKLGTYFCFFSVYLGIPLSRYAFTNTNMFEKKLEM